jgi:hypothetical protein
MKVYEPTSQGYKLSTSWEAFPLDNYHWENSSDLCNEQVLGDRLTRHLHMFLMLWITFYMEHGWAGIAQCYIAMAEVPISAKEGIFLFSTESKPALGPTQPPIQWVVGPHFLGVKRLDGEAHHSPQLGAEVKNGGAIPPLHHTHSWRGAFSTGTTLIYMEHNHMCII